MRPTELTTSFTYDALARPTEIDYSDPETADRSLSWSERSELASIRSGGRQESYRYDPAGRLLRYAGPAGRLAYSYDEDGRLASRSQPQAPAPTPTTATACSPAR